MQRWVRRARVSAGSAVLTSLYVHEALKAASVISVNPLIGETCAPSLACTYPAGEQMRNESQPTRLGPPAEGKSEAARTHLQRHVEIKALCSFGEAHPDIGLLAARGVDDGQDKVARRVEDGFAAAVRVRLGRLVRGLGKEFACGRS